MVLLGNFWYFFFIFLAVGVTIGLYFLFRNKSMFAKKFLIASLVLFNLALHFIKLSFPHYSQNAELALESAWFINICGVSTLTFPFIFFSKSDTAKDWML